MSFVCSLFRERGAKAACETSDLLIGVRFPAFSLKEQKHAKKGKPFPSRQDLLIFLLSRPSGSGVRIPPSVFKRR